MLESRNRYTTVMMIEDSSIPDHRCSMQAYGKSREANTILTKGIYPLPAPI